MDYTIFPHKTNFMGGAYTLGHVSAPYQRLVELFNLPFKGDGKDTDAEWHILLTNQHPIAIYNYRNGKAYGGKDGLPLEDITTWVISGHYDYDFATIREFLEGKTSYAFEAKLSAPNVENLVKRLRGIADHIEQGQTASSNSSDYHSWNLEKKTEPYAYPQSEKSA